MTQISGRKMAASPSSTRPVTRKLRLANTLCQCLGFLAEQCLLGIDAGLDIPSTETISSGGRVTHSNEPLTSVAQETSAASSRDSLLQMRSSAPSHNLLTKMSMDVS